MSSNFVLISVSSQSRDIKTIITTSPSARTNSPSRAEYPARKHVFSLRAPTQPEPHQPFNFVPLLPSKFVTLTTESDDECDRTDHDYHPRGIEVELGQLLDLVVGIRLLDLGPRSNG